MYPECENCRCNDGKCGCRGTHYEDVPKTCPDRENLPRYGEAGEHN